jgi:hypothetical protein
MPRNVAIGFEQFLPVDCAKSFDSVVLIAAAATST